MYKLIDTHSHLFTEEFDTDRTEVMNRAREAGITHIVMPNIDIASIEPMLRVCTEYPDLCYPTIGLHPTEVKEEHHKVLAPMKTLLDTSMRGEASHAPFIAIGEVGLDLYWDTTYKKEQQAALEEQISWALEYDLPIIIALKVFLPMQTTRSSYTSKSATLPISLKIGFIFSLHFFLTFYFVFSTL